MYEKTYLLVYTNVGTLIGKHEIENVYDIPDLLDTYTTQCIAGKFKKEDLNFYIANSHTLSNGECVEKVDLQQARFQLVI